MQGCKFWELSIKILQNNRGFPEMKFSSLICLDLEVQYLKVKLRLKHLKFKNSENRTEMVSFDENLSLVIVFIFLANNYLIILQCLSLI